MFACTSANEVIDLVQGGQGVFGIAVGHVWREVQGTLSELPSERPDDEIVEVDELAMRRAQKSAG